MNETQRTFIQVPHIKIDTYLCNHSDMARLCTGWGDTRQRIILPSQPRRQIRRAILNRHVLERCLWVPYTGCPAPFQPNISNRCRRASEFTMERSELPFAIAQLAGFHIPDVIPFRLSLFTVLVEARNIWVRPEIIPNLDDGYMLSMP